MLETSHLMAKLSTWLSIKDLGEIYGISSLNCGRTLQKQGWRDRHGRPTPSAIKAGAACNQLPRNPQNSSLWNAKVCKAFFEKTGHQPISRKLQVEQWAALLNALEKGSPSIDATAEDMAKDLPKELIKEVNIELTQQGCNFQIIKPNSTNF